LSQTLPTTKMELVVVHSPGALPHDIPRGDLEVRSIPTEKQTIGEKLALGVASCKGRVVAFLEDDDVWAPTKLARVAAAFEGEPHLGFYHNGFAVWHANDPTAPPPPSLGSVGAAGSRSADRYRPSALPLRAARRILRNGGLLNTSSIAVRRDLLLPSLERLARTTVSAEIALFVAMVQADAILEFDPAILTGYRRHARAATTVRPGALEDTLQTVGHRATEAIAEFRSNEGEVSYSGPRAILRFLTFSLETRSVVASLPPSRRHAVTILRSHLSELRLLGPPNSWPTQEVVLLFAYIFSPRSARVRLYRSTVRDASIA
jgi:hypothetical protein